MNTLGDLESRVMQQLWTGDGPQSVREVHAVLVGERDIAYTTVMTVLDRLAKKGLATRQQDGRAYRYDAAQTREQLVAEVMHTALEGSGAERSRGAGRLRRPGERRRGRRTSRRPGAAGSHVIDVPPLLVAGLLAAGAAVLVRSGPPWVARWPFLRQVPRAAVVLWQAGAVAALLCVLRGRPGSGAGEALGDRSTVALVGVGAAGAGAVFARSSCSGWCGRWSGWSVHRHPPPPAP